MELLPKIIIAIIILVVLYYLIGWFLMGSSKKLSGMKEGTQLVTIPADDLPASNNSNNYTYSTWIYINDWNYRYGEKKVILSRMDGSNQPSPSLTLDGMQNNLVISVACYPTTSSSSPVIHNCNVNNIPIQRWVNIIISLNGRTLDVYINGKLTRTCVLPGIAKVTATAPIVITPNGGFSGWTSETNYRVNTITPQEAWNIYSQGFGGNIFSNLFNKYKVKVSLVEDNITRGSLEI